MKTIRNSPYGIVLEYLDGDILINYRDFSKIMTAIRRWRENYKVCKICGKTFQIYLKPKRSRHSQSAKRPAKSLTCSKSCSLKYCHRKRINYKGGKNGRKEKTW